MGFYGYIDKIMLNPNDEATSKTLKGYLLMFIPKGDYARARA